MFSNNSKAHIYYLLLISCIPVTYSVYFPLNNTITLLEHQFGKKYDSLIIVSDTEEIELIQNHVLRNEKIDQTIGSYYYLHFSLLANVSSFMRDFENALKVSTMISLVVIFDFKVSNNVKQLMCNLQGEYLQNNTFLFILIHFTLQFDIWFS